jgi:hypothetical protein
MPLSLAWLGSGAPRMEVAHVEHGERNVLAIGTQLGSVYELRYKLESRRLSLEVVGERSRQVDLGDADFFDLSWSPLFNSLPVIRDGLLQGGPPRTYVMCWVDVPSLDVRRTAQRYESVGHGLVRFTADDFVADIRFDDAGFVLDYPGLATRV